MNSHMSGTFLLELMSNIFTNLIKSQTFFFFFLLKAYLVVFEHTNIQKYRQGYTRITIWQGTIKHILYQYLMKLNNYMFVVLQRV